MDHNAQTHHAHGPERRRTYWNQRAGELAAVVVSLGRFPTATDFADGGALEDRRALQSWIRNQRRRDLTEDQIAQLNAIPGYSWTPLDDAWQLRLQDYIDWVASTGSAPRYRSRDQHERRLADWIARQKRLAAHGELAHHRVSALRELMQPSTPS